MQNRISTPSLLVTLLIIFAGCQDPADQPSTTDTVPPNVTSSIVVTRGIVVSAEQVTSEALREWQVNSYCVAMVLSNDTNHSAELKAATAINAAKLPLEYFIEIGRCPEMAAAHPEWMASLQGHAEWRKLFPAVAEPTENQVVKNSPWVPILYAETFAAHEDRVASLLRNMPIAEKIWLHDLQGAPSACGCGHPLCRWTADYGPIKTATPLDNSAAAKFVSAIQELSPESQIVPIFAGECEQEDEHSVCCGVACFDGKCWTEFTAQLDAVAQVSPLIGVSSFYIDYERDLSRYGTDAAWIKYTVRSFQEMPPKRKGTGVASPRLVPILQGWNVSDAQISAQIKQANACNVSGWRLALTPIDQSWQPVMFDIKQSN